MPEVDFNDMDFETESEQEEAEENHRCEMEIENRFDDWKEGARNG
jgi:hypothetical protein